MSKRNIYLISAVIAVALIGGVALAFALWPTDFTAANKELTDSSGHWNESADFYEFALNDDGASYAVTGFKGVLSNLEIPSLYNNLPVTAIKSGFSNLRAVTSVVIPSSVTVIEDNAFINSLTLVSVKIDGDIGLTIGKNCFRGCPELATVTYTAGRITSLGGGAFDNCDKLSAKPIV